MINIKLESISKSFGPVKANHNINIHAKGGEILGLLGENGAGKTTLMNILSGLYQPDSGNIMINGKKTSFASPKDAISAGIGMVHQHFMLVPIFSVTENVILGNEETGPLNFLKLSEAEDKVKNISEKYSLLVDPKEITERLAVGSQQRVEIIKVLFRSAEVLIFDEPTAVLTPQEVSELFNIMKSLKTAGKAIIFITHKLHEVLEICDRISILRAGEIVGDADPKTASNKELANMMVGRPVNLNLERKISEPGDILLDVNGLTVLSEKKDVAISNISFNVKAGEIVGVAGVQGNGQTELVDALTGLRQSTSGKISYFGKEGLKITPRRIHQIGVRHIPEDRQKSGIIGNFSVSENLILNNYYCQPYSKNLSMDWNQVEKESKKIIQNFDIRTPSQNTLAQNLSGGNQQKLVVGREMSSNVDFLIASQPTRGIDVGSIEYIHEQLIQSRNDGKGILLVSTELEEILSLSDRILVLFRGQVIEEFSTNPTAEEIGLAMAGHMN
jgi:simple sugar transport system ATP-binding protein